jgi:hypothetical protein
LNRVFLLPRSDHNKDLSNSSLSCSRPPQLTIESHGGVLASLVAGRTRELGIRAALGAERLACGLIAAWWLTRLLQQQLCEVRPADPGVLAAVVGILGLVALLACLLPALRATKISPIEALRCE